MRIKIAENVYVRKPNHQELSDAQLHASKIFNEARKSGAVLRVKLDDYMREQGVWDDHKVELLGELTKNIVETVTELEKGKSGKYKKLSEARQAAINVRIWRAQQVRLLSQNRELDAYTVEGQAENARFDYLIIHCVVNEENEPIFKSLEDYNERGGEDWARKAAEELSFIVNGEVDKDWESKLPENIFLLKYGFVNNDLSLVDKDGNLVDREFNKLEVEVVEPVYEEFDDDLAIGEDIKPDNITKTIEQILHEEIMPEAAVEVSPETNSPAI